MLLATAVGRVDGVGEGLNAGTAAGFTVAGATADAGGGVVAEGCFPQLIVNGFAGAAAAAETAGAGVFSAGLPKDTIGRGVAVLDVEGVPPKKGVEALGVEIEETCVADFGVEKEASGVETAAPNEKPPPPPAVLGVFAAPRRCGKLTPGAAEATGVPAAIGAPAAPPNTDPLIGVELNGVVGAPKIGGFSRTADAAAGAPPAIFSVGFSRIPADKSKFSTATFKDMAPGAEFIM